MRDPPTHSVSTGKKFGRKDGLKVWNDQLAENLPMYLETL